MSAFPGTRVNGSQVFGLAERDTSPDPQITIPPEDAGTLPSRKPTRLSLACNRCRQRKVRCDASIPKCRNCTIRKETCETTDLRRPSTTSGLRSRTQADAKRRKPRRGDCRGAQEFSFRTGSGTSTASVDDRAPSAEATPDGGERTPGRCTCSATEPADSQRLQGEKQEEAISWLYRGYRESNAAQKAQTPHRDNVSGVSPDAAVNTDDTPYRVKFVGGTSVQCLFAFVDLHMSIRGLGTGGPSFRHGMSHSEEFTVPLVPDLPELPSRQVMYGHVDTFMNNIWPLFPAVDREDLVADVDRLFVLAGDRSVGLGQRITPRDVPSLAMLYLVVCIGKDESSGRISEESTRYLSAGYSLSAHLTGIPYVKSAQALFVLSLALHGQARDGQAWHVVGHAIRIAHSVGLHKSLQIQQPTASDAPKGYRANHDLYRRLWWSCFALEKLLQMECGRPSGALTGSFDRLLPSYNAPKDGAPDYFTAWVSLAGIMGSISDRLYSRKFSTSQEMFMEVCALNQALVDWDRSLPEKLRPRNEGLEFLDAGSDSVLASFLSQQYFCAQITVLRVSLIFPHQSYIAEVKKRSANLPDHSHLLSGAALCASAARSIAYQALQLADRRTPSVVLGAGQSFLAAVVLALGILRDPIGRLARADVELLSSVTLYLEDFYARRGQDGNFIRIFTELRDRIVSVFREDSALDPGLSIVSGNGGGLGSALEAVEVRMETGAMLEGPDATEEFDMDVFGGRELWSFISDDASFAF